jgi:hypothetical protein
MTISRTYQWYRHATSDPTASPVAISGATSAAYVTVTADITKYLHMKETATNSKGSATATSNVIGPVIAAGATYSPAAGTIAPYTGTLHGNRPLEPRIVKRSEQEIYDGEIVSMNAMHQLMHDTLPQTIAVANGLWSAASTWSNGVPTAGMTAHIPSAFDVMYDLESSAQLKYIMVHGKLRWDASKDTKLVCDTIHTGPASYFEMDVQVESTVPGKPRADVVFIGDAPGSSARLGLMTMGKVKIRGAQKPEKVDLGVDPAAGAQTLTVKAGVDISKWRVGDEICILSRDATGSGPDPQYTGPTQYGERNSNINNQYSGDPNNFKKSHDEIRTITGIAGQQITISAPLTWAHPTRTTTRNLPKTPATPAPGFTAGQPVSIPPRVTNLSRSIRFSSGGSPLSDNQKRAHIMFMASDQIDVRYAEAKNMGRTDTNATLWISEPKWNPLYPDLYFHNTVYTDNSLAQDLGNPNNVRGRYAWHCHGTGVFGDGPRFSRNMCVFKGLTAWAPQNEVPIPGWAITHHNSRLSINNCVVYNVRGAGIISESGSEIGQWMDNTVSWARGDGYRPYWGGRQREQPNHYGHGGVAYENQSRAVLQQGNEFTSCHYGWVYSIRSQLSTNGYGLPSGQDPVSVRHAFPFNMSNGGGDMPDRETYGKGNAQIPDLNFCTGVDFDEFFRVDHRVEVQRGDPTAMIAVGWKAYGGNRVINMDNYTYKYFFRDFAYWGGGGGDVTFIGTRTSIFGWKNGIVEGFNNLVASGSQANFGPGWIDIATNLTQTNDSNPNGHNIKDSTGWPTVTPSVTISTGVNNYRLAISPQNPYITFTGRMTDAYSPGGRHWPEFQEPSYDGSGNVIDVPPTDANPGYAGVEMYKTPARRFVELNGCYQVGGNWFVPCWVSTVDWGTFKHFVFKIDVPMLNTADWPAGFLAKHTITPVAPTYPLLPEDTEKPFAVASPPSNSSAPYIYGAAIDGFVIECDPGAWSAKPNDVDWYGFVWKRAGTAIAGAEGRTYKLTTADVGQAIVCEVTAYNSGGKSPPATTAAVTPKAAYTGKTPDQIFGSALRNYWIVDGPDMTKQIYGLDAKSPGVALGNGNHVEGWAGEILKTPTVTGAGSLDQFNTQANLDPHGWTDKSRTIETGPTPFDPVTNIGGGRVWMDLGSGNEPMHFWLVVRRSLLDQNGNNGNGGQVLMAGGHSTYIPGPGTDPQQNKLYNDAGNNGRVISSAFSKGSAGIVYHGRNSIGSHAGLNNSISTVANGGSIPTREVNIGGYNNCWIGFKAFYWVNSDTITAQQHADMQAYLAHRYL